MTSRLSPRDFSLAIALLAVCAFFAWQSPQFLSARNLSLLMIDFSITAMLAVGMLLVLLPGHIDLSAGSGVGLIGGIGAVLVTQRGWPAPLALAAALGVALVLWFAMGNLIVRQRIPAFIITLGGLLVFKGLFWRVINNETVPIAVGGQANLYSMLTTYYLPRAAGWLVAAVVIAALVVVRLRARAQERAHGFGTDDGELTFLKLFIAAQAIALFVLITNQFRGVPLPALLLGAVALAVWTLTQHTPWGRYLYAIGGNEEAAIISGVPVARVTAGAFTLMGVIVALTGFLQTASAAQAQRPWATSWNSTPWPRVSSAACRCQADAAPCLRVLFGALIIARACSAA